MDRLIGMVDCYDVKREEETQTSWGSDTALFIYLSLAADREQASE